MRIVVFLLALLVGSVSYGQKEGKRISKRVSLLEEFTDSSFKMPSSVLFYSGANYKLETNYEYLFKKLKKKTKKSDINFGFRFDRKANLPFKLESFDQLDLKFTNDQFEAICVLIVGDESRNNPFDEDGTTRYFTNNESLVYYDFYLLLVEANTNKVLKRRKYHVAGYDLFKNDNNELVKAICKEFE